MKKKKANSKNTHRTAKTRRINIMTSCEENYAKLVPVQLLSISDNLVRSAKAYEVHFYLFHSRVGRDTLSGLAAYAEDLGISFHEVKIDDTKPYEELMSKGGGWVHEAYYSLECHRYLPPEEDRVLYIDAADVLVLGDVAEYYFADFEGKSLIATSTRYKLDGSGGSVAMESDDLGVEDLRQGILRGLINSGSYVMNLKKMRRESVSLSDFIALKNALVDLYPDRNDLYFGDQGIISAAFAGDINYFGYPEIKNLWYQPYNFCIWFFDRAAEICDGNPWYVPRILHFAAGQKPWKFTAEDEKGLKPGQWPYYKIYELYTSRVPKDIFLTVKTGVDK